MSSSASSSSEDEPQWRQSQKNQTDTFVTPSSGGSYIFPAKDVTTYQANKLLSNEKESYQQLTPANGMFLVSDVNSPDK